ncbi:MAG TPA: YfhO family protein [Thermoanaerobaculia bacterium]
MRRVLAAYAALAVVTAFYSVFFGELPVPTDCALRLLPGRMETSPSPLVGGNDERWDLPTQYLPWTKAVSDAYRRGQLPLRFAANGCGNPLWANPQAQVLTPTTWITWPLPEPWALAVAAALRLWLAAAGVYLWLRRRRLSDPAAAAGGLAYGFSLAFTTWLHYPLTYPQAVFPWLLLALERLAEGGRGGFAGAVSAIAALLLGGFPEGEFLVVAGGVCVFATSVLKQKVRAPRLGSLVLAALLGLGLTAVVWLPQLHAVLASERSEHIAREASDGSPMTRFTSQLLRPPLYLDLLRYWVVPEARGNPRDGDKFGTYSFAGRTSGYAGILVLALSLAAFAWRRAPAAVSIARVAFVLLLLYVLWFPPLRWLTDAAPGLRFVLHRVTTGRMQFLAVFLMALLAAFQLDRLRSGKGRVAALCACALLLLAIGVVFVQSLGEPTHPPLTAWRAVRFVLPALLLASTLVLLSRPPSPRGARVRSVTVLFLAGTGLELLRIGARFNPGTRPDEYFPMTPVVRNLRAAAAGGRFAANTGALSGMAYMYGLEDVGMQDPMTPARYLDALAAGTGYDAPAHPLGNVRRMDAPMLDFLNARARLDGDTVRSSPAPDGVLPEQLIGCADREELLRRLATEPDLVHAALVVGRDEAFGGNNHVEIVSLERPSPERVLVRVRSDAPRVLVLPESDDGGWSADSAGQPLPTLLVNGAFLGVRIPAGDTRLVCRYLPPGFRKGLAASALAAIVAVLALARRKPAL